MSRHDVFWGTHGCHRGRGHNGPCACEHLAINDMDFDEDETGDEWLILTLGQKTYGEDEPQYAAWKVG